MFDIVVCMFDFVVLMFSIVVCMFDIVVFVGCAFNSRGERVFYRAQL